MLEFINKYKYKIIFLIIILLSLFLWSIPGEWAYLDNRNILNKFKDSDLLRNFYSLFGNVTYFSYDSSTIRGSRIFGNYMYYFIDQKNLILSFFLCSIYFSYSLLRFYFNKISCIFGSLFFAFNPISIYFLSVEGYFFSYLSLPIIIFSFIKFFNTKRILYLFLLVLGILFLISYTRITGLYSTLLIFIIIYFYKDILRLVKKKISLFFLTSIVLFFVLLPLIFSLFYPYLNGDKKYFSGISNYSNSSIIYSKSYYNNRKSVSIINGLYPSGIIPNFDSSFQKTKIFRYYGIFFIVFILISSLYLVFRSKKKRSIMLYFIFLFFLLFIFMNIARFTDQEVFTKIIYKYYPFLANNLKWLFVLYIPILVFLYTFILDKNKKNIYGYVSIILLLFYIFLSVFPIIDYKNNDKLSTISLSDIPIEYKDEFFVNHEKREATIFIPGKKLYYSWAPYPLLIPSNSNFKNLFSGNPRVVGDKQKMLNKFITDYNIRPDILAIFNLKSIYIFLDILNSDFKKFDYFKYKNYLSEGEITIKKYKYNNKINEVKNYNNKFIKYSINSSDDYDFFIYSPHKIYNYDFRKFYNYNLNIYQKPVIVDNESFNKPLLIDDLALSESNKNIQIDYKTDFKDISKHYLKITNFDKTKPFLLQLNLTYGNDWEFKFIDKKEYKKIRCLNENKDFYITNNSYCNYKNKYLGLGDIKYLFKDKINNSNHFEGNFIGNTWYLSPDKIESYVTGNNELYAVIIYKKQVLYTYILLFSIFVVILILFLTLIQESRLYIKNKKDD